MHKPVIAVDGPAASGKGTIAKKLAEELGFAYMDTGILYRATAFELLSSGMSIKDKRDAHKAAKALVKQIQNAQNIERILLNPKLRDDKISQAASRIAVIKDVRETLNALQRDFAQNPGIKAKGAILDGRDIGTVICPNADLKLFITAETQIRAKRRLKELQSGGIAATYSTVLDDMLERDKRDMERIDAPMTRAKDAVIIDNSNLDAAETFDLALTITKERLNL